jgi:phosphate transport system permease protein
MESTGNRTRTLEQVMHIVFLATATASIISVILISAFIFMTGIPTMAEIGLGEFLLGRNWFPRHTPAQFGIFPMIISSIYVTIGAIVLGVPCFHPPAAL